MAYRNAAELLPADLLEELRKYIPEGHLYIPGEGARRSWGSASGQKREMEQRNRMICRKYEAGRTVRQLAAECYLTESSVYRILKQTKGHLCDS